MCTWYADTSERRWLSVHELDLTCNLFAKSQERPPFLGQPTSRNRPSSLKQTTCATCWFGSPPPQDCAGEEEQGGREGVREKRQEGKLLTVKASRSCG